MLLKRKQPAAAPVQAVRVFRAGAEQIVDPDPTKSPEEIRDMLSERIPWLTNAAIEITEESHAQVHIFTEKAGTRGGSAPVAAKQTVNFVPNQGKRG